MHYLVQAARNIKTEKYHSFVFDQLVIFPQAFYDLASFFVESSMAFYHIVIKGPFKILSICQVYSTLAVLRITLELSFVIQPLILDVCEISIVKLLVKVLWLVIENVAISVKTALKP